MLRDNTLSGSKRIIIAAVVIWLAVAASLVFRDLGRATTTVFQASKLPSQTGRVEGTSRIAEEDRDRAGYLVFGPYKQLEKGAYTFELKYHSINSIGTWDVVFDAARKLLNGGELPVSENGLFRKRINVPQEYASYSMEFRVLYPGKGRLKVDELRITKSLDAIPLLINSLLIGLIICISVLLFIKLRAKYTSALIMTLLILMWVMRLWQADLRIPFTYTGDELAISTFVKGMIDNGWFLHNSFIGMPFGLDRNDYPMSDTLNILLLKIVSLFLPNWALTLTVSYLGTFLLTTLSTMFVFTQFGISYLPSLLASLLFSFVPYHFIRGDGHFFLSAYYMVPLIVMVILWVYSEENFFFVQDKTTGKRKLYLLNFKVIVSVIIALLVASAGVYYAFFAAFFLFISGISGYCHKKSVEPLLVSGLLVTLIATGVLINILPSLVYKYKHGENIRVAKRNSEEAELYGMKIAQLLLPVSGHRFYKWANLKAQYNSTAPLVNENDSATLGIIGSLGFLSLTGSLFCRGKDHYVNPNLRDYYLLLSFLNISAVLLGTVGGLGSLFSLVISPQIRAYNRICIYIAFFSLFAVAILLETFYTKHVKSNFGKSAFCSFVGILLVLGIFDQTTRSFAPAYEQVKAEYNNDNTFVRSIESSVPEHSMIFELPYVPFPENPSPHKMGSYEHFKAYLHSKNLRWSYGAMQGRVGDSFQKRVAAEPVGKMAECLAFAGFEGIFINTYGYADGGADMQAKLLRIFNTPPMISADHKLVFFNMGNYIRNMKAKYDPEQWEAEREIILDKSDSVIFYGSELPSQTGRIDGTSRIAEEGKDGDGFLIYGPYEQLQKGVYNIQLSYSSTNSIGKWEIAFDMGRKILDSGELPVEESGRFCRSISIVKEYAEHAMEFRVMYPGQGSLKIYKLEIKRSNTD
jgi:phosphoglycerol transferase